VDLSRKVPHHRVVTLPGGLVYINSVVMHVLPNQNYVGAYGTGYGHGSGGGYSYGDPYAGCGYMHPSIGSPANAATMPEESPVGDPGKAKEWHDQMMKNPRFQKQSREFQDVWNPYGKSPRKAEDYASFYANFGLPQGPYRGLTSG
jgi:hypothetical protein